METTTNLKSSRPVLTNIPERFKEVGFTNFEKTKENTVAYEECLKYAKQTNFEDGKNSLVLFGNVGTGKTHLAISIMKNLPMIPTKGKTFKDGVEAEVDIYRPARGIFLIADEFFQELNDAVTSKCSKMEIMQGYLKNYDCICIDDLSVANYTEAKRENFYIFINRAYLDCKRIIITLNFSMKELKDCDPRVTSRLNQMAQVIEFAGSDFRKKF